MKVICRTPQTGKTTDLLEYALKNNCIFVCHSERERERLQGLYIGSDESPPPVIATYKQLLSGKLFDHRNFQNGVVIDNLDYFVQQLVAATRVRAVAINQDLPDMENV